MVNPYLGQEKNWLQFSYNYWTFSLESVIRERTKSLEINGPIT